MEHPKDVGDRCTLAVMLALRGVGFPVLVPFGENTRYDLVIDDGGRLLRVQCKSGRVRNGAVTFKTASSYAHHPNPRKASHDYQGQIDLFAVYCAATEGVYLIPIEEVSTSWECLLRLEPARNGQRRRIRPAAEYEIGKVHWRSTGGPAASAGAG
jgi:hypothetical protein